MDIWISVVVIFLLVSIVGLLSKINTELGLLSDRIQRSGQGINYSTCGI